MSNKLKKIISLLVCFLLLFQQSGLAQSVPSAVEGVAAELDIARHLLNLHNSLVQDKFRPLHLRYLSYDTLNNNFKLLLDKGDFEKGLSPSFGSAQDSLRSFVSSQGLKRTDPEDRLKEETQVLLNYFFIGLTLPNDTFWVNLRPDSPDNIIDNSLAQTDVGRIMLETDLQLKKDTAQFTSPQIPEGKEYWDKLYQKAGELFGTENITIPTLTRPWIVPDEIIIRETLGEQGLSPFVSSQGLKGTVPEFPSAYIYKATLKVMLEEDYLRGTRDEGRGTSVDYSFKDPRLKELNAYSSQLIRELIIPKLTKEVNSSKRYASLRQVYYSLILAQWFKARFNKQGTATEGSPERSRGIPALIDSQNLTNLTSKEPWSKTTYFKAYQKSFKEGEYSIQEPAYTPYGQTIRSYFSGGMIFGLKPEDIAPFGGQKPSSSPVSTVPATGSSPVKTNSKNISMTIPATPVGQGLSPQGTVPASDVQVVSSPVGDSSKKFYSVGLMVNTYVRGALTISGNRQNHPGYTRVYVGGFKHLLEDPYRPEKPSFLKRLLRRGIPQEPLPELVSYKEGGIAREAYIGDDAIGFAYQEIPRIISRLSGFHNREHRYYPGQQEKALDRFGVHEMVAARSINATSGEVLQDVPESLKNEPLALLVYEVETNVNRSDLGGTLGTGDGYALLLPKSLAKEWIERIKARGTNELLKFVDSLVPELPKITGRERSSKEIPAAVLIADAIDLIIPEPTPKDQPIQNMWVVQYKPDPQLDGILPQEARTHGLYPNFLRRTKPPFNADDSFVKKLGIPIIQVSSSPATASSPEAKEPGASSPVREDKSFVVPPVAIERGYVQNERERIKRVTDLLQGFLDGRHISTEREFFALPHHYYFILDLHRTPIYLLDRKSNKTITVEKVMIDVERFPLILNEEFDYDPERKILHLSFDVSPERTGWYTSQVPELFKFLRGDEVEMRRTKRSVGVDYEVASDRQWSQWGLATDASYSTYWLKYEREMDPAIAEIVINILRQLPKRRKPYNILDIFAGDGRFLRFLNSKLFNEFSLRYFHIEKNDDLAESARRSIGSFADVIKKDMREINDSRELLTIMRRESPHIVIGLGALTHSVVTKIEGLRIARILYEALADGGYLILTGFNPSLLTSEEFKDIGFEVLNMSMPANIGNKHPEQLYILRKPGASSPVDKKDTSDTTVQQASNDVIRMAVNRVLEPAGYRLEEGVKGDLGILSVIRKYWGETLLSELTASDILAHRQIRGFLVKLNKTDTSKMRPEDMPASVVKRAVASGELILPISIEDGKLIVTPGIISIKDRQVRIAVDNTIRDVEHSDDGGSVSINLGALINDKWSYTVKLYNATYILMANIAQALALQEGFDDGDAYAEQEFVMNSMYWRDWSVAGDGREPSPMPLDAELEKWEKVDSVDLVTLPVGTLVYLGGTGTWVKYIVRIESGGTLKLWLSTRTGAYQSSLNGLMGGRLQANETIVFPYFAYDDQDGRLVGFERRTLGSISWGNSFPFFRVLKPVPGASSPLSDEDRRSASSPAQDWAGYARELNRLVAPLNSSYRRKPSVLIGVDIAGNSVRIISEIEGNRTIVLSDEQKRRITELWSEYTGLQRLVHRIGSNYSSNNLLRTLVLTGGGIISGNMFGNGEDFIPGKYGIAFLPWAQGVHSDAVDAILGHRDIVAFSLEIGENLNGLFSVQNAGVMVVLNPEAFGIDHVFGVNVPDDMYLERGSLSMEQQRNLVRQHLFSIDGLNKIRLAQILNRGEDYYAGFQMDGMLRHMLFSNNNTNNNYTPFHEREVDIPNGIGPEYVSYIVVAPQIYEKIKNIPEFSSIMNKVRTEQQYLDTEAARIKRAQEITAEIRSILAESRVSSPLAKEPGASSPLSDQDRRMVSSPMSAGDYHDKAEYYKMPDGSRIFALPGVRQKMEQMDGLIRDREIVAEIGAIGLTKETDEGTVVVDLVIPGRILDTEKFMLESREYKLAELIGSEGLRLDLEGDSIVLKNNEGDSLLLDEFGWDIVKDHFLKLTKIDKNIISSYPALRRYLLEHGSVTLDPDWDIVITGVNAGFKKSYFAKVKKRAEELGAKANFFTHHHPHLALAVAIFQGKSNAHRQEYYQTKLTLSEGDKKFARGNNIRWMEVRVFGTVDDLGDLSKVTNKVYDIGSSSSPVKENTTRQNLSRPLEFPTSQENSISTAHDTTGGIDFRSLPIVTQAVSNLRKEALLGSVPFNPSERRRTGTDPVDLNEEWSQIERMTDAGITPSSERIKEYIQTSCAQGSIIQDRDKILLCISDILRLEEERCESTDATLKDILVVLESINSAQEFKEVFLGRVS